MAYSYKGAIAFGLIYIPITLHAAIKNNEISFKLLHKKHQSRIQYKKTCDKCNEEVKTKDIVKAYEYENGRFVVFDDNDFEKLKTKKDKTITINQFVEIGEIDPLFYDKAYYVVPQGAENAYHLLAKAMEKANKVGIAKTILGNKETLIAIRVKNGQMLLNTMHFLEDIKKNSLDIPKANPSKEELSLALSIIDNMTKPFLIADYVDEYKKRLHKAIEAKINGKMIVAPRAVKENQVVDLMEALQLSLKKTKVKK